MYYIMENLYSYLNSDEIKSVRAAGKGKYLCDKVMKSLKQTIGVYLGRQFRKEAMDVTYVTGGPGYILDSVALHVIGCSILYLSLIELFNLLGFG